jgi:hypothetical protein
LFFSGHCHPNTVEKIGQFADSSKNKKTERSCAGKHFLEKSGFLGAFLGALWFLTVALEV